ncbi:hypothetical protein OEZ86_005457 [Tetradesmus obliquus]|nr:hypothetical protein OEZ86_005457 [Tetradesmus obliquus]
MEEFLKNKSALATAARRELGGGSGTPAADMDDDVGSCLEGSGHEAELARQGEHLSSLLQGVGEECKVNRELAGLLAERLDSSRKALECLLRLVTCLMEAEAAYSSAMSAAAKAAAAGPLAAPADSGGLAAAVEGLVQLPAAAAAGHRQLYLDLQTLVEAVRALWRKYNAAAKELKNSVSTAQRQIDSSCKQLQHCLSEHRAACEAFDAVVVWQSTGHARSSSSSSDAAHHQQQQHRRGNSSSSVEAVGDAWTGAAGMAVAALHLAAGSSSGGSGVLRPRFAAAPTRDPWASEGKLAAEQAALQKWQDQERELLQRGFDSLQALEQERVAALMQAGQALAESYSSAVAGMPAAAAMLQGMLGGLGDAGEAGVQHLAQVAADMRATSEQLAARQAEAVCVVSQELFCSPEIIRQGAMELWQPKSSSWAGAHFVLTRAGFLHWFASMEDVTPLEPPLNLCRCSFEAGAAPVFHLVEAGSGGWLVGRGSRKITLQASSVEECCEWAIALREAIALASSTGAAAASSGSAGKSLPSRLSR